MDQRAKQSGQRSISAENYIKAIFHLERKTDRKRVNCKSIANALGIAQPSVTGMIKNLSNSGMLDYQPYKGVRLTDAGRMEALQIIRKHRLVEVFLIETLGLGWDEVHEEAEQLEHAISEKVANRLEIFLGFPSFDPHGDPIPDRHGQLPQRDLFSLASVQPPTEVIVARVLDQSAELLRYFAKYGLIPGATILVQNVAPFDGPLELIVNEHELHLSHSMAHRIMVTSCLTPELPLKEEP